MAQVSDYSSRAEQYAESIVAGEIPASKPTIRACRRFLNDLERKRFPFVFVTERANAACEFIEGLRHVKGVWARRRECIRLEDWQCFIVCNIFGWHHKKTHLRRFRRAYIEVPRKNAKSTLAAGIAKYMFVADNEAGAEVYAAATTREQAKIVWSIARQMCLADREMTAAFGIDVRAHMLWQEETGSVFRALSADGDTLDGLNIHCAIIDELHAHPTRDVVDVLETATGSREQPLLFAITTAGTNRAGICYEQRDYALKVLKCVAKDETLFALIYTIDPGDDWTVEVAWKKANPNYGVSVMPDDIAQAAYKAKQQSSATNNFLTKRLNVWVSADTAWMDMLRWTKCEKPGLDIADFAGRKCFVAVDLASKIDIASVVAWFPPGGDGVHTVFHRGFLPSEAVESSDVAQLPGWVMDGWLTETEGAMTDQDVIKEYIQDLCREYDVQQVAFDPYQGHKITQELLAEGLPVVVYPQNVKNMSEPMKDLEGLVRTGNIQFPADPCLEWMASNVVCHVDVKDNIYPRKALAGNKIDGIVAMIMARGLSIQMDDAPSIYESQGLIIL